MNLSLDNAVEWHSKYASHFDAKYISSKEFIERYAIWSKLIDKYSDVDKFALDLGCGSGVFSVLLAKKNKHVVAIDASKEMLNIGDKRTKSYNIENIDFVQCDINTLELSIDNHIDIIICSSVLEYLDDLDECLRKIVTLLSDTGMLILSLPNRGSFYRKVEPYLHKLIGRPKYFKYVKNVTSLEEIKFKIEKHGMNIVESAYYGPTPILSKMLRAFGMPRYSDNMFVVVAKKCSEFINQEIGQQDRI